MLRLLIFGANKMLKLHIVLYANIRGGDSLRFKSGQEIPRLGHSTCILCVIVLFSVVTLYLVAETCSCSE